MNLNILEYSLYPQTINIYLKGCSGGKMYKYIMIQTYISVGPHTGGGLVWRGGKRGRMRGGGGYDWRDEADINN